MKYDMGGGYVMKKGITEANIDLRALDRTPYRNMPGGCCGCGYMGRPSLQGIICTTCHLNYLKRGK